MTVKLQCRWCFYIIQIVDLLSRADNSLAKYGQLQDFKP